MEELKDIKTIEHITNYDFFYYILIVLLIIFIITLVIIYLKKYRVKKIIKETEKERRYKILESINYNIPKLSVYLFSENAIFFLDSKNEKMYFKIMKDIEKYKYIKEEISITKEDKKSMKDFIQTIPIKSRK